jgi:hypothetical protein
MRNNECVVNGYLGTVNGFARVYANRTQAEKAASRLNMAGFKAFAFQSCRSNRFMVSVK